MSSKGHSVTVITSFPSRPSGVRYPGYSKRFFQIERGSEGYKLIRCFSVHSRKSSVISRSAENISFGLFSSIIMILLSRPDVIYSNTWPIFAAALLSLVAKLRRIPLILSIQDLYPESLIAQGRTINNSRPARLIRCIDSIIARQSSHVIVISEGFAAIYRKQRRIPVDRLSVVPNWADSSAIDVSISNNQFRRRVGVAESEFLLAYGGNIGMAAGIETLIEAARYLATHKQVRLLFAGEGSHLHICRDLAKRLPERRIVFHSPWEPEETSEVLRAADLLVLPTRGGQSLASVPSKLIYYMLAARPILALALKGSDVAGIVERARCGWVVEPDQPHLLVTQIKNVYALSREELNARGQAGRDYALKNLTKEICLPRVIDILETAAIRRGSLQMSVELSIRKMRRSDIEAVVATHLEAFPGFFLSFLGAAFLRELYTSIVLDPTGISFVCCQGTEIKGFVAGTDQPAGFYSRLVRQRWWCFALASIGPTLRNPAIAPRLLRALKMPKEAPASPCAGVLMSIGILPHEQGKGVARALVQEFLSEARRRGLAEVNLTTDRLNNELVNRFYEQLGFRVVRTFTTPEGRQMNEYTICLRS